MRNSITAMAIVLAAAGCSADQPAPSVSAAAPTPSAQQSQEPPASVGVTPSASDEPTREPTAEPVTISLEDIADAFRASGVEVGEVRPMTVEDYGLAPMANEGLRFLLPSLGGDAGGRIMRYDETEVADRAQAFYEDLGDQSAALFSHVFRHGPFVIQVNGTLPQSEADLLEAALDSILPDGDQ